MNEMISIPADQRIDTKDLVINLQNQRIRELEAKIKIYEDIDEHWMTGEFILCDLLKLLGDLEPSNIPDDQRGDLFNLYSDGLDWTGWDADEDIDGDILSNTDLTWCCLCGEECICGGDQ